MQDFLEIDIRLSNSDEEVAGHIIGLLSVHGFEGFREEEGRVIAYAPSGSCDPGPVKSLLETDIGRGTIRGIESRIIPFRNWNEEWEKDYSPVMIADRCLVRAPFHPPREGIDYELVISPGMSFGTAHHATTRGMMESMLSLDWQGKVVLDFGCGTGILSILASKMGASGVLALDNDPVAVQAAGENARINGCLNIEILEGQIGDLRSREFDIILANLNLNVLLSEMGSILTCLKLGGTAILSGFYEEDLESLDIEAAERGLVPETVKSFDGWVVALYRKAD